MPYGLNEASMRVGLLTDLPFRSEIMSEINKRLGTKGIETEVSFNRSYMHAYGIYLVAISLTVQFIHLVVYIHGYDVFSFRNWLWN
jgi:hypothetical protein